MRSASIDRLRSPPRDATRPAPRALTRAQGGLQSRARIGQQPLGRLAASGASPRPQLDLLRASTATDAHRRVEDCAPVLQARRILGAVRRDWPEPQLDFSTIL